MEHMQDKVFDQLFKDQFEGAEMQPPAAAWDNIQKKLKPARKRKQTVYWMAAATVAVALTASVLLTRTDKVRLQGKAELVQDRRSAGATRPVPLVAESSVPAIPEQKAAEPSVETPAEVVKVHPHPLVVEGNHPAIAEEQLTALEVEAVQAQPSLVATPGAELTIVAAVHRPVQQLNDPVQETEQPLDEGRTRIRNAGDLVNFVVDKIDRREQKLVQFDTDDDDNSSLVAINIGPFKFNSKKNK
jgi:hypothetical protein